MCAKEQPVRAAVVRDGMGEGGDAGRVGGQMGGWMDK